LDLPPQLLNHPAQVGPLRVLLRLDLPPQLLNHPAQVGPLRVLPRLDLPPQLLDHPAQVGLLHQVLDFLSSQAPRLLHHLDHRLPPLPPLPPLPLPHLQRPYQQPAAWEEHRHHLPGEGAVQHRHHLPGEGGAVQHRHHLPEAVVAGQKPTLERAPTTILQL
jgi:hypothetical protein